MTTSFGSVTSNVVTLTVQSLPSITTQPASQTILAGQNAAFVVAATGTPAPVYTWQISTDGGTTWTAVSGPPYTGNLSATLTVTNPSVSLSGAQYRVLVTSTVGEVTSNPVTLAVNVAPAFTTQPVAQAVLLGQGAQFVVAATGTPVPTYQWQMSAAAGTSWTTLQDAATYAGTATAQLVIGVAFSNSSGLQYRAGQQRRRDHG